MSNHSDMTVKAWKETITIPTYKLGEPDKNPMFLENRVYQGSSGVVYPHAVIDKVYDDKEDKEYIALYLENDYLKIMILPELGGRIQMAYDKTNDYHFIYYNNVIKPALVGLAGPWISGGIEFNWPQHHRPSTYDPIDFSIEENADGSKTVWVNEYEKMFRTKCALGFTLYPEKSYIELHAKLFNRTPFPQTFLWWANPAVAVDEHYQSVFPPDVNAVFDHGKRDVSSFPIAKGTYYKVDYSPGTDISVYTNIPVPTSYMAVNSEFNFVGGYHHKRQAGMLHVADHHVSPGKKQWTWGCGEFGQAWDKQLTDSDGPYFELMCGMFTDNQPDFGWIMPNEVREFKQYFMPYKGIGYVKNASTEVAVNIELHGSEAYIGVYLTEAKKVSVILRFKGRIIYTETRVLSPVAVFSEKVSLNGNNGIPQDFTIEILDADGKELIKYTPVERKEDAIPDPATAIAEPSEIATVEELYLAGLHLEQYRHATYSAQDYYLEALRRDATDIRSNNALGLLLLRKGQFADSEVYFRKAIEKLTKHNPNPYDGEPLYNLGLALKFQRQFDEAFKYFYKAAWNAHLQDVAHLQLASIECIRNNWNESLTHIEKSLARNYNSAKARHLKAAILRKLGWTAKGIDWINKSLEIDYFDFGSRFELYLALKLAGNTEEANNAVSLFKELLRNDSNTYIEISLDYANAGMYEEALELLSLITGTDTNPLTFYYTGFYNLMLGQKAEASASFSKGFSLPADKVFPNRVEDIEVLQKVISERPEDYKAGYYLGNFYYAKRRYADAKECWEKAAEIGTDFPTVFRNLGIAYYNKFNQKEDALVAFEKAFNCDQSDSRILFELDQLYKRFNYAPLRRLEILESHLALVQQRDDLYTELVTLYTLTGQYDIAKSLLASRNFHPWEGGEGKVSGLHILVHVELAKLALNDNKPQEAIQLLKEALVYPANLGEGKLYGAQENDVFHWLGAAYDAVGDIEKTRENWEKASIGLSTPTQAIFYNDQQPDKIYYQGEALEKLGDNEAAAERFHNLIKYGKQNKGQEIKMDFFAVSLPDLMIFDDDLSRRNDIHCYYLIGLGYLGLKDFEAADKYFSKVLSYDAAHFGAVVHSRMLGVTKAW
jgi:tetratricopeptide (TPR) repeat protein